MAEADAGRSHGGKRILVVDDSSLVRLYYRSALEKAGFSVEQAINGIEGLEKTLTQAFDLVIVDVNMPRMDGIAFLRSLRSQADIAVAGLPALMISTESEREDMAAAAAAGANFYLIKPVSEADLVRHAALLAGAAQ